MEMPEFREQLDALLDKAEGRGLRALELEEARSLTLDARGAAARGDGPGQARRAVGARTVATGCRVSGNAHGAHRLPTKEGGTSPSVSGGARVDNREHCSLHARRLLLCAEVESD